MSIIQKYRSRHSMSQRQFAKMVNVDNSIVSRIEAGLIPVSIQLAVRIERATGGDINALSLLGKEQRESLAFISRAAEQ